LKVVGIRVSAKFVHQSVPFWPDTFDIDAIHCSEVGCVEPRREHGVLHCSAGSGVGQINFVKRSGRHGDSRNFDNRAKV
jgi:hypothetical protein